MLAPYTIDVPDASERPTVLVFHAALLGPTETFIRAQAEAMRRYRPIYVGLRRVPGLDLPEERVFVLSRGGLLDRAREIIFKRLAHAGALARALRGYRPRLIHAHFGPDGALAMPIARALGIPLVVTFHGNDATVRDDYAMKHTHTQRRYVARRRQLQRAGSLFLGVSNFIRGKLLEQAFPAERTAVQYNGVDSRFFNPDRDVSRERIVLFVGRLVEKKGCDYLIRAMQHVQREIPDAELIIVGDGPLRASLEALTRELGVRGRFLGRQTPAEVRQWMNRARVFSVPSVTAESGDSEGFPTVFSEAAVMGLPSVTFASGGNAEAVLHGKTGYVAAERDWPALAGYLSRLLRDDATWARFSAAGEGRFRTEFDLARCTAALEHRYTAVLAGRASDAVAEAAVLA
jgi:glycosyltransferase involved in cell wall biosynthesis